MAEQKKKSFVLYCDYQPQFELLSDEEAGILIKAIFEYANTGVFPDLPPVLQMAFSFIRSGMDRNSKKYEDICARRREYGRAGGLAKASKCKQKLAKLADSDSESDSDSDSESDSDSDIYIKGDSKGEKRAGKPPKTTRFTPPTVEQVKAYCQERGNSIAPQHFVDFYETRGWMAGKNKMKDWKAAIRTWERNKIAQSERKEVDSYRQEYDDIYDRIGTVV